MNGFINPKKEKVTLGINKIVPKLNELSRKTKDFFLSMLTCSEFLY